MYIVKYGKPSEKGGDRARKELGSASMARQTSPPGLYLRTLVRKLIQPSINNHTIISIYSVVHVLLSRRALSTRAKVYTRYIVVYRHKQMVYEITLELCVRQRSREVGGMRSVCHPRLAWEETECWPWYFGVVGVGVALGVRHFNDVYLPQETRGRHLSARTRSYRERIDRPPSDVHTDWMRPRDTGVRPVHGVLCILHAGSIP